MPHRRPSKRPISTKPSLLKEWGLHGALAAGALIVFALLVRLFFVG